MRIFAEPRDQTPGSAFGMNVKGNNRLTVSKAHCSL